MPAPNRPGQLADVLDPAGTDVLSALLAGRFLGSLCDASDITGHTNRGRSTCRLDSHRDTVARTRVVGVEQDQVPTTGQVPLKVARLVIGPTGLGKRQPAADTGEKGRGIEPRSLLHGMVALPQAEVPRQDRVRSRRRTVDVKGDIEAGATDEVNGRRRERKRFTEGDLHFGPTRLSRLGRPLNLATQALSVVREACSD
jgi:hypothetical protein